MTQEQKARPSGVDADGQLSAHPAASLWEQLDEPPRRAALEILARLIARMLVAAANEASHE